MIDHLIGGRGGGVQFQYKLILLSFRPLSNVKKFNLLDLTPKNMSSLSCDQTALKILQQFAFTVVISWFSRFVSQSALRNLLLETYLLNRKSLTPLVKSAILSSIVILYFNQLTHMYHDPRCLYVWSPWSSG